jgi:UDP:flavonoid glycosyltransferase YjiC (YdhE family)
VEVIMTAYLISTMPAAGHVAPFVPLASRLVADGHEVVWHTGAAYADRVHATGARFAPFQHTPDFDALPVEPDPGTKGAAAGLSTLRRLFVDRISGQVRDYDKILDGYRADVLIVDMCCLGAAALHERGGPPFATLGINPLVTLDPEIPPFGSSRPPATTLPGRAGNRLAHRFTRLFMSRLNPALNEQRAAVGLPPMPRGRNAGDLLRSPLLHLQPATLAFEYPRKGLERQVHFVGPLIPPPPTDVALPDWWGELDGSRPVVHVTQGTVATDPDALLRPAMTALADEDVLVVATGTVGGPVPGNVRTARFIPHPLLLPKVDVMVSNGGYNGVLSALAHGVPLVVAGRSEDKPAVCARVAWSGAGIDLRTDRPSADRIRAAVRAALTDPSYRDSADRIRADFARHDPAGESVWLLERLAVTGTRVTAP